MSISGINKDARGVNIGADGKSVGFFGSTPAGQQAGGALADFVASGTVTDDDSAATNGTAVYVATDANGVGGHLESTAANNANSTFAIGTGPSVLVTDADSPAGVQVYYDEASGFLAVLPVGSDVFVPASDGKCIRVQHDADAATNGVALYFDDNGATASERLLFVSPTDADGEFSTDSDFSYCTTATAAARAALVAYGLLAG